MSFTVTTQRAIKFSCKSSVVENGCDSTRTKAGGIRRLPHRLQLTVGALEDYFEGLRVRTITVFFKLLVRIVISDK